MIIFGDINPSGKLPITFPRSVGQLPLFYSAKPSGRGKGYIENDGSPLYPFGYGLSYTTYAYSNLKVDKNTFSAGDVLTFTVDVTNTGRVAGKESVLLFSSDLVAALTPDIRRLRAFEKIALQPGETKSVTLQVPASDLAFVGYDGKWILEAGDFRIQVGNQTVDVVCTETKKWETPNI